MKIKPLIIISIIFSLVSVFGQSSLSAESIKDGASFTIVSDSSTVQIDVLEDHIVRVRRLFSLDSSLKDSPMIQKKKFNSPSISFIDADPAIIMTARLKIEIVKTPHVKIRFKNIDGTLILEERSCKENELTMSMEPDEHFYGLGEKVRGENDASVDYRGHIREFGKFGNVLERGDNFGNANMSVPVLMSTKRYAFFLDNTYRHRWDFTQEDSWSVEIAGGELCYYFIHGSDLPSLIKHFTGIVGRPFIPPKFVFGMLQSEYAYDNWEEVETELKDLRARHFPVDVFLLDMPWYGGRPILSEKDSLYSSRMGRTAWDTKKSAFSNSRRKIKQLKREGIEIMVIEHGYLDATLPEFSLLARKGYLVKNPDGSPVRYKKNPLWGEIGMIDFTDPRARNWWWRQKHIPLIKDGIAGFWLDMGEPPMYEDNWQYYHGGHAKVHNLWNFYWAQMIKEGYDKDFPNRRFFILSRSGTAGCQRFGVGFWSGDVLGESRWLIPQVSTGINIGFSGMPYWGTDIGGFQSESKSDRLYTRWFQFGVFNSIFRTHGNNIDKKRETSPAKRGIVPANLKAVKLRYQLLPYTYTLAREAYETGMPFMRGLMLHYPDDPNVIDEATEFLWGRDLLVAPILNEHDDYREIYLPEGAWTDFYTNLVHYGPKIIEKYYAPIDIIPIFARAGAIIPMMQIGDQTRNTLKALDPLILRIYPHESSRYELYEDDGSTNAYRNGKFSKTEILSNLTKGMLQVTIKRMAGNFKGNPRDRIIKMEIMLPDVPLSVKFNGTALSQHGTVSDSSVGWLYDPDEKVLYVETPRISKNKDHVLTVDFFN